MGSHELSYKTHNNQHKIYFLYLMYRLEPRFCFVLFSFKTLSYECMLYFQRFFQTIQSGKNIWQQLMWLPKPQTLTMVLCRMNWLEQHCHWAASQDSTWVSGSFQHCWENSNDTHKQQYRSLFYKRRYPTLTTLRQMARETIVLICIWSSSPIASFFPSGSFFFF